MKRLFHFYVLIDPRDNLIKYVGKTVDPKSRYSHHISEARINKARHPKCKWIAKLLKLKLVPKMKVIFKSYFTVKESDNYELILIRKIGRRFELKNSSLAPNRFSKGTTVYQYDMKGKYIRSFKNSNEARIETKIYDSNILACCKGKRTSAGGYSWSFLKNNTIILRKNGSVAKKVAQYSLTGILIKIFKSARDAQKETNIHYKLISSCCNGNKPTAYGYKWRLL